MSGKKDLTGAISDEDGLSRGRALTEVLEISRSHGLNSARVGQLIVPYIAQEDASQVAKRLGIPDNEVTSYYEAFSGMNEASRSKIFDFYSSS